MNSAATLDLSAHFLNLKTAVRTLHPAYFAMVMATGIVAISLHMLGISFFPPMLTWLNIALFAILWVLTAARIVCYPRVFFSDLTDHRRGVGFFTIVAGTCILGSQLTLILHNQRTATVLWLLGIMLWLVLIYAIFTAFTVKATKPTLSEGINGGWLIAVVATQSVSNLGGLLASSLEPRAESILLFSLLLWLCGGMLYIWTISLIFYRYMFFSFSPSDLMPPYWINMGAMAISALAGTTLIANAERWPLLGQMIPFLYGFTLLFWATATWWIPMLGILGAWRHLYKKFRFSYDPLYWGAVFPLGMYTACSLKLAGLIRTPMLNLISRLFIYVAVAAWTAAFFGMLHSILTPKRGPAQ